MTSSRYLVGILNITNPIERCQVLFILLEIVFYTEIGLCLIVKMGEVSLEAGAEIDMPAPETTQNGFGVLLIVCAKFTVLARIMLFHKTLVFAKIVKNEK